MFELFDKDTDTQISGAHMSYLREMAEDIGNKIVKPIQLKIRRAIANEDNANQNWGVLDQSNSTIYLTGAAKSRIVGIGAPMSAAETLIHELVHAVTGMAILKDSPFQNRLQQLYDHIVETGDYTLFMPQDMGIGDVGYEFAKERAIKQWNYVFGDDVETSIVPYTNSVSEEEHKLEIDHGIQEFMAFAIANENFRANLAKLDTAPNQEIITESWLDTVSNLFTKIMNWIRGIGNTPQNGKMLAELDFLYHRLGGATHSAETTVSKMLHRVEKVYAGTVRGVTNIVSPVTQSAGKALAKSKNSLIGNIGDLLEDPQSFFGGMERTFKEIEKLLDTMDYDREGFLPATLHEIRGTNPLRYFLAQANRKTKGTIDTLRRNLRVAASKTALNAFKSEQNKNMSKSDRQVLGELLRIDTAELLNTKHENRANKYDSKVIEELLRDPKKLEQFITKVKRRLTVEYKDNSFWYTSMAENLGQYMYSNTSRYEVVRLNAYTIANMFGTSYPPTGDLRRAENLIDELASLAGLRALPENERNRLADIIGNENTESVRDNGFTFMMSMHNRLKEESETELFHGKRTQMMKGYTRQISDPNVTFKVVPEEEGDKLVKMGYLKGEKVPRDQRDPNATNGAPDLYLYYSRADTDNGYMGQAISYTDGNTAGTDLLHSFTQIGHPSAAKAARLAFSTINTRKTNTANGIVANSGNALKAPTGNVLVPVFDDKGVITNYRYMMAESTKRDILKKDTSFDLVLGATAGNVKDKYYSTRLNRELLGKIHDYYVDNYSKAPNTFVAIKPNSNNKRHREIWRMLPENTKQEARRLWGNDQIIVPAEDITLVFGQRTPSVANLEITDTTNLEGRDKYKAEAMNALARLLNNYPVRVAEGLTKSFIKVAKDTIVIKSGVTLFFNIMSNMYLLRAMGVPLDDIVKGHMLVFKKGSQYHTDEMALRDLTFQQENSESARKDPKINAKIRSLKNRMAINPVAELIDAFTYQSIVEDIAEDDTQYGYKDRIEEFIRQNQHVSRLMDAVPDGVKRGLEYAVMAHNTPIYQAMKDMTQLSDFAGRYILFQHLTKKDKMPDKAAHRIIMDAFVDYDLPTHRYWQYGNEMGFTMFTKFFFRIQKLNYMLLGGLKLTDAEVNEEVERVSAQLRAKGVSQADIDQKITKLKKQLSERIWKLPNVLALILLEQYTGFDAASTIDENPLDYATRITNPINLVDAPVSELMTVKLSPF